MKCAEDFRKIARQSLEAKWVIAVAVGLVSTILGGISTDVPDLELNMSLGTSNAFVYNFALPDFNCLNPHFWIFISGILSLIVVVAILFAVVYLILGSFIEVGYAKFNLNLVDKKIADFNTLFEYFSFWKTTSVSRLLRTVYVFLWSWLFIIPGIVARYSYAMTDYILAENPNITASEAIKQSKAMMSGNRWRMFCLEFSFIGWDILASLTFGIGNLWLTPYKQAAIAAFYRDVSGTADFYET